MSTYTRSLFGALALTAASLGQGSPEALAAQTICAPDVKRLEGNFRYNVSTQTGNEIFMHIEVLLYAENPQYRDSRYQSCLMAEFQKKIGTDYNLRLVTSDHAFALVVQKNGQPRLPGLFRKSLMHLSKS